MKKTDIEKLILERSKIESLVDYHSKHLSYFPSYPNGLIPEKIRQSSEYKFHEKEYEKSFQALRKFNERLTNVEKREIRKYKRMALSK